MVQRRYPLPGTPVTLTGAPADISVRLVPTPDLLDWSASRQQSADSAVRARAARLRDRRRAAVMTASHLCLRAFLAALEGVSPESPEALRLKTHEHRAPVLEGSQLAISLSRAEDAVLMAAAPRPIGVDIEQRQTPRQARQLQQVLHPAEQRLLRRRLPGQRARTATEIWTRKEARLKADGLGLDRDPALDLVGSARHPVDPPGYRLTSLDLRDLLGHDRCCAAVCWSD